MKKYLIFFFLVCSISTFSKNMRNLCATCQNLEDTEEYVYSIGYGHGVTLEVADSLSKNNAYITLLNELQNSIRQICYKVKIENHNEKVYLAIKYFDRKEQFEFYHLTKDSLLTNQTVLCDYKIQTKDGEFHTCCVLIASRKYMNRVYDNILRKMVHKMATEHRYTHQ